MSRLPKKIAGISVGGCDAMIMLALHFINQASPIYWISENCWRMWAWAILMLGHTSCTALNQTQSI